MGVFGILLVELVAGKGIFEIVGIPVGNGLIPVMSVVARAAVTAAEASHRVRFRPGHDWGATDRHSRRGAG